MCDDCFVSEIRRGGPENGYFGNEGDMRVRVLRVRVHEYVPKLAHLE